MIFQSSIYYEIAYLLSNLAEHDHYCRREQWSGYHKGHVWTAALVRKIFGMRSHQRRSVFVLVLSDSHTTNEDLFIEKNL